MKPLLQSETFVRIAAPLAFGVVLFGLWEIGCRLASIPVYLFPKPSDIFESLVHNGPSLLRALMVTLRVTLLQRQSLSARWWPSCSSRAGQSKLACFPTPFCCR
jgi:hypothetical protein